MKRILLLVIYGIILPAASAQNLSLERLAPQDQVVQSIAYSPNGQLLAGTDQQSIHVWPVNKDSTGAISMTGAFGPVMALAFASDNKNLLAAHGNSAKIWNIEEKQVRHSFDHQEGTVLAVAYSPDDAYVALGGTGKTVQVWHVGTGELHARFEGHQKDVNDLVFTLDGKYLVTASADKTIKVWDLKGKTLHKTLQGHKDWVKRLAVSPDSVHIASAGFDSNIFVWNIPDKTTTTYEAKVRNPHSNWISGLDISANNILVSVGHDNKIALYNLYHLSGKKRSNFYVEKMFKTVEKQPSAVLLNPATLQVAVATLGKGIYLDKYFQTRFSSPHEFKIRTVNGEKVKEAFTSTRDTATIGTTVTRPEEVKVFRITNEKTKESQEYTTITAPEFVFEVFLPEKTNTFKVTIEDKDPNIKPAQYHFKVDASF